MIDDLIEIRSLLREVDKISHSQAGQDLFVLALTGFKKKGTYLEIGCGHPKDHNNTWLLEKLFDWTGYSVDKQNAYDHRYHAVKRSHWPKQATPFDDLPIEIREETTSENSGLTQDLYLSSDWRTRKNTKYIQSNAVTLDYNNFQDFFDYLQVDLDNPMDNYTVLEQLTARKKFTVITFEHDIFTGSDESKLCQTRSRSLLADKGYVMVANNVTIQPGKGFGVGHGPMFFEDWWADPQTVSAEVLAAFSKVDDGNLPKYYSDILFKG